MSKSATFTSYVSITGDGVNDQEIPIGPNTYANSPGYRTLAVLSAGDNQIKVPTSPQPLANICIIIPPSGSSNAKTLKGVAADTGIKMGAAIPFSISLDSTVTAFYITSAGQEVVNLIFI